VNLASSNVVVPFPEEATWLLVLWSKM